MNKLFALLGAVVALALVGTAHAAPPYDPMYPWHDKGVPSLVHPSSTLYEMSRDLSSTPHQGSASANVQTSFTIPADVTWMIIGPAGCKSCGWSDSATGGVSLTASTTGSAAGGDDWGLASFAMITKTSTITLPPSKLRDTETLYFMSSDVAAPAKRYAITYGSR